MHIGENRSRNGFYSLFWGSLRKISQKVSFFARHQQQPLKSLTQSNFSFLHLSLLLPQTVLINIDLQLLISLFLLPCSFRLLNYQKSVRLIVVEMLELAKPVESVEKHKEVATVKLLLWVACKKLWTSEKVKFLKLLEIGRASCRERV